MSRLRAIAPVCPSLTLDWTEETPWRQITVRVGQYVREQTMGPPCQSSSLRTGTHRYTRRNDTTRRRRGTDNCTRVLRDDPSGGSSRFIWVSDLVRVRYYFYDIRSIAPLIIKRRALTVVVAVTHEVYYVTRTCVPETHGGRNVGGERRTTRERSTRSQGGVKARREPVCVGAVQVEFG